MYVYTELPFRGCFSNQDFQQYVLLLRILKYMCIGRVYVFNIFYMFHAILYIYYVFAYNLYLFETYPDILMYIFKLKMSYRKT